ncbi:MAG: thioredoxin-disulfide reductase [Corynebacterium sp.]|nr:thioredoxin-disulfide reductase [Corynebacterium sp.]
MAGESTQTGLEEATGGPGVGLGAAPGIGSEALGGVGVGGVGVGGIVGATLGDLVGLGNEDGIVSGQNNESEATLDPTIHNVIIVGSGPAGYTAALYAARSELKPLVFEGIEAGGLLMTTTLVENFPGFPEGIQGPALMENMRAQAEHFGADLRMQYVDKLELTGEIKRVHSEGVIYQAKTVILAMGAAPRYLGVPGEDEFKARGVSACATCDGFFFKDKNIAVIGGGDSAMEEAIFLTRFGKTVTLIHRREQFRASAVMVARARENEKITFVTNATVNRVLGTDHVTGVEITHNGNVETLPMDGIFVAIGHDPTNELVRDQLELDEQGYVVVQGHSAHTSIPGVFAAGDLVDPTYQQAITAAGSGCRAALDAEKYLG